MSEVSLYRPRAPRQTQSTAIEAPPPCEDRVLDGPASGGKGSKGRN